MTLSLRLALQYARRRPARSIATLLGVMAGVAGLRAIELGTRGALTSVQAAYQEASGPAALNVIPAGDTRAPLPNGIVATLEGTPDVNAVLPMVTETTVRVEELKPWEAPLAPGAQSGTLVIGVDFARERDRHRWTLSSGSDTDPGGALAGAAWARARKLGPGSSVRLVTGETTTELRISGLIEREGLGTKNYGSVIIAPIEIVRASFGLRPGEVQEAALVLTPVARIESVAQRLRQELGPRVAIVTAAERGKDVAQRLGNIRAGTDLTSSIALFLAAFLIYGLYATAAAERRRDLGLLRTIGATRLQAAIPLMIEAGIVSVPGAVLGTLLGAVLAQGVALTLGKVAGAELRVPPADLEGAVRAALAGFLVAMAAAAWPAIRAALQEIPQALRALGGAAEQPSRRLALVWGSVAGLALAALAMHPPRASNPALTYVLVLSLMAGCTGVLPFVIAPLAGFLSQRTASLFGGAVAIGVASPRWRPNRSGLAAGAVLGCVAMVGGISALGTGMRTEMSDWADHALSWDLFVRRPSGLGADTIAAIRAQPGVRRVAPAIIRPVEVTTASGRTLSLSLVGLDTQAYDAEGLFIFPDRQAHDSHALGDGTQAYATTVVAEQFGLKPGTEVTIATPAGPRKLRIAAEVLDYTQNGFALVVDNTLLYDAFEALRADVAAVRLAPDAKAIEVAAALDRLPGVKVETRAELKRRIMALVDESMGSMDSLLWLGALIGLLAVGASVAQGAVERRGDVAALRALGMTRGQVAAMLCAESVVTTLVGACGGALLGMYLGWVFAESTHTLGIPLPFVPPWKALVLSAMAVVVCAVPAAWLPARRAAQVSPGEALRMDA